MRYFEITEADAAAQADAQRAQRDKLQAANDKIAKASQTYQASLRTVHDSATAAKKKLATPSKPPTTPTITTPLMKPLVDKI